MFGTYLWKVQFYILSLLRNIYIYFSYFPLYKYSCAHDLLRRREKGASRACPACNKLLSSRLHLCGNESSCGPGGGSGPTNSLNINDTAADGLLTIDTGDIMPPLCAANGRVVYNSNEKTIICNGLTSAAPNVDSTALLLTTNSSPKPLYRSNLSLASLSLRASSLTIDSSRNATSSV